MVDRQRRTRLRMYGQPELGRIEIQLFAGWMLAITYAPLAVTALPVNLGFMIGPAVGSVITRGSVFAVFPTAAALTALGIGALWVASKQSAG